MTSDLTGFPPTWRNLECPGIKKKCPGGPGMSWTFQVEPGDS